MGELIRLKSVLNLRKFQEAFGDWFPVNLVPSLALVFFIPISLVIYAISSRLHGSYFYEILGVCYLFVFVSWAGGALTGLRLNEYLEFNSLSLYPISRVKVFIASVFSGLLDPSAVSLFAPIWGISLCIGQYSNWEIVPILILLNILFLLKCIATSQVIVFFYQFILHRSRFYQFFMTVVFPMITLVSILVIYGLLLAVIPMVDSFTSPDFTFLDSTKWFSSSVFILIIKNFVEGDFLAMTGFLSVYLLEFVLLIWVGAYLVRLLQGNCGEDSGERITASSFRGFWDTLLGKVRFMSTSIRTLILKDWKILLREPSTKSMVIIQLFSGVLFWFLSYCFALFSVEMSTGAMYEFMGGSIGMKFFAPETIGRVWPLFYYGSLWLIGVNFANNIFGRERSGINQLFLLPVNSSQLLLSKNLALILILAIPSLIVSLIASFIGLQSWHILQSLWLSFVMGLILIFLSGNFVSILFPVRVESGASQNLSRIGLGRSILLALTSIITGFFGAYLSIPILIFCVFPMVQSPHYIVPFGEQTGHQLSQGLQMLVELGSVHFYGLLYAMGAYLVGLFLASRLLENRKEQILLELNRSEV
ncbi:MAG: hypothetical protein VX619_00565 [bacterium]|nr:hypothetical protein [bacterium]